jgi:hypothetical protein
MFLRQGQNRRLRHRECRRHPGSQLLEKNGGDDGTRIRGLCRDSEQFARN